MKRNAALCAIVLASVLMLYGQLYGQNDTPKDMTGWICTSACVTKSANNAGCDASCAHKDKRGEAVFVDDQGKVSKISNPDRVKGKMGKKVKAKCKMNKDDDSMFIFSIYG
jgi:hypothetical protein